MKKLIVLALITLSLNAHAQTPVQNFTLKNVADGSDVSLDSYAGSTTTVILFVSNVCPYDNYYGERIRNMISTYSGRARFLLINSYQETEESADKMKEALAKWGISVPYLADKDQVAFTILGAKKSPEAFVLTGSPGKYKIAFNGPIDDNAQSGAAVTKNYLRDAIENTLAGKSNDYTNLRTIGCTIRKK